MCVVWVSVLVCGFLWVDLSVCDCVCVFVLAVWLVSVVMCDNKFVWV